MTCFNSCLISSIVVDNLLCIGENFSANSCGSKIDVIQKIVKKVLLKLNRKPLHVPET